MRIARMQVNHITNPLGFDLGKGPTFSWVLQDALGTCAQASRVVVTRADEVVADTGWSQLDAKACVFDVPLAPRTRYEWTVSVLSNAGDGAAKATCLLCDRLSLPVVSHQTFAQFVGLR